jgi:hypothetical protein
MVSSLKDTQPFLVWFKRIECCKAATGPSAKRHVADRTLTEALWLRKAKLGRSL